MRRAPATWATAAAALLLALLAAGCSSTKTVTVSSAPPVTSASAPPRQHGPVVELGSFRSPTSNIGCVMLGGVARCDIAKRNWQPPSRPKSCPEMVDFGQGLQIGGTGTAAFVCAGDTALNSQGNVLAYGSSSKIGALTCESARAGVTCRRADGHGFFISIQSYRLF